MCHAIPARVVAVDDGGAIATVTVGNVRQQVSLALVEDVRIGEFLLIHVGFALNRISTEEAEQTLALFAQADSGASPGSKD